MIKDTTLSTLRRVAKKLSFGGRFLLAQRILRRMYYGAPVTVRVTDFDGDLTMDLRLSEHMQSRMFWVDYYSHGIIALIKRLVTESMVFVDVGANIGEITLVAAKRVGGSGKVIAFEPVDRHADRLQKNILDNQLPNVTVVRAGLSDRFGACPIYESCGQGTVNDEHHGLNSLYPGPDESPVQTVNITTLDDYLRCNPSDRVDFIKIDVEGAELPCLRGAAASLQQFRPHLIIEVQRKSAEAAGYDPRDILDYLAPLGYEFSIIDRAGRLSCVDRDTLSDYQNVLCSPRGGSGRPHPA